MVKIESESWLSPQLFAAPTRSRANQPSGIVATYIEQSRRQLTFFVAEFLIPTIETFRHLKTLRVVPPFDTKVVEHKFV